MLMYVCPGGPETHPEPSKLNSKHRPQEETKRKWFELSGEAKRIRRAREAKMEILAAKRVARGGPVPQPPRKKRRVSEPMMDLEATFLSGYRVSDIRAEH